MADSEQITATWGTLEELLLACAVKRHGFKDWNSVSMELQNRSSLPPLLTTARNCELKFQDKKRKKRKRKKKEKSTKPIEIYLIETS